MRKIGLYLVMILMAGPLMAEEANWLTSLPKAEALAKKENKLVMMNFTGSDWCPGCKRLDAEVLSTTAFADYAKKNLVLVLVDFPQDKPQTAELQKANQELQSKFKVNGYPTLVAINPEGKVLWVQEGVPQDAPALSAVISGLEKAKKEKT